MKSSFLGHDKKNKYHLIGHTVGLVGGVYYSFAKKTGFWKGLGVTLVFVIVGGAVGYTVDYLTEKKDV